MIVCVQYWFTPKPVYGNEYKSRTVFKEGTLYLNPLYWRKGLYEAVVVWKIKQK